MVHHSAFLLNRFFIATWIYLSWLGVLGAETFPLEDYQRSVDWNKGMSSAWRDDTNFRWTSGDTYFVYRHYLSAKTSELLQADLTKLTVHPLFDQARLAAALSHALGHLISPDDLSIAPANLSDDGNELELFYENTGWTCHLKDYSLEKRNLESGSLPTLQELSPSQPGQPPTNLSICNQTSGTVSLDWIDYDGKPVSYGELRAGESRNQPTYAGHVWALYNAEGKLIGATQAVGGDGLYLLRDDTPPPHSAASQPGESDRDPNRSPDGRWEAYLRDHNLWLQSPHGDPGCQLSADGTADDGYELPVVWSPDSRHLVARRVTTVPVHQLTLVESSPAGQTLPVVHTFDYPKAGDPMPHPRPVLFDVETRQPIAIAENLFPDPMALQDIRWPSNQEFTMLDLERSWQIRRLLAVDAQTGQVRPILDEESKTGMDNSPIIYLDKSREILWETELQDGWRHLFISDAETGQIKRCLTPLPGVVISIDHIDEDRRQVWFWACGMVPGEDPYFKHLYRVNFDGSGFILLTPGNGTHSVAFSTSKGYLLDTWSRLDAPPMRSIRDAATGKELVSLPSPDLENLPQAGWPAPEPFVALGRDDKTPIYGAIWRPSHFNSKSKYPVIEDIYAGPGNAYVPKSFSPISDEQSLAELGFIIVKIDGMGTGLREKSFEDLSWKNLGDAGFPDRIKWIKAAAACYPQLDLDRVGIVGTSAGGQSALRGLLMYPDFYKAAVADCGCHDNRVDKQWWNERNMGLPVGAEYAEQSNVTQAYRLRGKLLLMVGEMDTNVDPASTYQVVNALIKANKVFDLLVMPGHGHDVRDTPYGQRMEREFFIRSLLHEEPPLNNES